MPLPFYQLIAQAEPQGLLGFVDKLARTQLSVIVIFVTVCTLLRVAIAPVLKRTPKHKRGGGFAVLRTVNEMLDALVYASVFVFLVVRPFAIQTFYIPSGSMLETLQLNDYIIANKFIYRSSEPKDGDIVVFRPPNRALLPGQSQTDFIKRLIGSPGELIEVRDGVLYRNGKLAREPYLREPRMTTDFKLVKDGDRYVPLMFNGPNVNLQSAAEFQVQDAAEAARLLSLPPAPIPSGFYMMMGDNRNQSFDSRGWGLVPRRSIIGRSEVIWFPFSRWRITR